MSPALKPAGRVQAISVGSPESPGLRQYVCQPGAMSRCRSTQSVAPGAIAASSGTSRAVTGCGSVADPADAGIAAAKPRAKTAANPTACRARYRKPKRAITGKIIAEIAAFRRPAPGGMAARGAVRYRLWALAAGEGHGKSAHSARRYRRHR